MVKNRGKTTPTVSEGEGYRRVGRPRLEHQNTPAHCRDWPEVTVTSPGLRAAAPPQTARAALTAARVPSARNNPLPSRQLSLLDATLGSILGPVFYFGSCLVEYFLRRFSLSGFRSSGRSSGKLVLKRVLLREKSR